MKPPPEPKPDRVTKRASRPSEGSCDCAWDPAVLDCPRCTILVEDVLEIEPEPEIGDLFRAAATAMYLDVPPRLLGLKP